MAVARGGTSVQSWLVVLLLLGPAGCGGSSSPASSEDYPLVEQPSPGWQAPVKMPNGSVVRLPALPTVDEADPSPTCERQLATFHDGSQPARRPVIIPPRVGLKAVAVTKRRTRLEWSFRELPADCRPVVVRLSVRNQSEPGATPTTKSVQVRGVEGVAEIAYPDFLPAPNVAIASAYSEQKRRGRTVSVLIRRSANVPADPPEPPPPLSAPAGMPVACEGKPRVVRDPVGDILTYQPGSPPARVRELKPHLSAIDVRRATVQIDGRTICARLVLERAPGGLEFGLTLSLGDVSTSACCAALRFRQSAGRLEIGYDAYNANGRRELQPVENAGAQLRGNRLTISGTLPPPSAWQTATRRMPSPANIGWTISTRYSATEYGPFFGDWLPRHDDLDQPLIRQR